MVACMAGHVQLAQVLAVEFQASLDLQNWEGWTAMTWAIVRGHHSIVKFLADRGASLHARSHLKWTPLHFAALQSSLGLVEWMLEEGADATAMGADGSVPGDVAADSGVRKLLFKAGAQRCWLSTTDVQLSDCLAAAHAACYHRPDRHEVCDDMRLPQVGLAILQRRHTQHSCHHACMLKHILQQLQRTQHATFISMFYAAARAKHSAGEDHAAFLDSRRMSHILDDADLHLQPPSPPVAMHRPNSAHTSIRLMQACCKLRSGHSGSASKQRSKDEVKLRSTAAAGMSGQGNTQRPGAATLQLRATGSTCVTSSNVKGVPCGGGSCRHGANAEHARTCSMAEAGGMQDACSGAKHQMQLGGSLLLAHHPEPECADATAPASKGLQASATGNTSASTASQLNAADAAQPAQAHCSLHCAQEDAAAQLDGRRSSATAAMPAHGNSKSEPCSAGATCACLQGATTESDVGQPPLHAKGSGDPQNQAQSWNWDSGIDKHAELADAGTGTGDDEIIQTFLSMHTNV